MTRRERNSRRVRTRGAPLEISRPAYTIPRDGRSKSSAVGGRCSTPISQGESGARTGPIGCASTASTRPLLYPLARHRAVRDRVGRGILEDEVALVASEGRLLRRVDASDETMRGRFAEICLERSGTSPTAATSRRRPRAAQGGDSLAAGAPSADQRFHRPTADSGPVAEKDRSLIRAGCMILLRADRDARLRREARSDARIGQLAGAR